MKNNYIGQENTTTPTPNRSKAAYQNHLINTHIGLVDVVAHNLMELYQDCDWLTEADLINAGYEGLYAAARTFDSTLNVTFKTYASTCIRNAMLAEIKRMFPIKVSDNQRKGLVLVRYESTSFDPSACVSCNWDTEQEWLLETLAEAMTTLDREELVLLYCRFGFNGQPMKLEEIANMLNVSTQAVHKRLKVIEAKLRAFIEGASPSYSLCA